MEEKKKKFVIPQSELVDFANDDIITASVAEDNDDWGNNNVDVDIF